jgi:hypothetical protein
MVWRCAIKTDEFIEESNLIQVEGAEKGWAVTNNIIGRGSKERHDYKKGDRECGH